MARNKKDLDGWKKNAQKYKQEYNRLKELPDGHVADWAKQPWNSHHWFDMFVEAERASPYLMGHIWGWYYPLSVIGMTYLWVTGHA
jgi:hypothetical protein